MFLTLRLRLFPQHRTETQRSERGPSGIRLLLLADMGQELVARKLCEDRKNFLAHIQPTVFCRSVSYRPVLRSFEAMKK
jgi:hypothetical protein